jgi:signal transduction histidine kinase
MVKKLKILMLEDVPEDADLIKRMLNKSGIEYEAKRVDTEKEFKAAILEIKPDVILSDHSLPQFNSMEALKICQNLKIETPFVLVTGTVSEEFAVNCLKEGADDYVLKSNLTRLPSAIMNAIKQREMRAERILAEDSLRKQNEELVKINKELDSLVYSASHDLRAPLKSVLGLVQLVEMDVKNKDYGNIHDYMLKMIYSIQKLDRTIKDIIEYSKNARSEFNYETIDFIKLINENFDDLKYMDGMNTIEKEIIIEKTLPFVTDHNRLGVILKNILANAIKYRDSGKAKQLVSINISITEDLGTITVSDNGIGIDKAYLTRIFDMFYRATEKSDGSGLGLYIAKEVVEKLRGKISVKAEQGKGSTFIIEIPNLYSDTTISQ